MALLGSDETDVEEKADEAARKAPVSAGDPVALLAAGSVLFSWYQFYVRGEKEYGIFTGLWAPTLLAAANYLQQKSMVRKIKKGVSGL